MSTPFDPQPCASGAPLDVNLVSPDPVNVNVVSPIPLPVILGGSTTASPTLTTATTGNGTTVDFTAARSNVSLFVQPNGTVTSGTVSLQGSHDGVNWVTIATTSMLQTGVNQFLSLDGGAFRWFRGIVSEDVAGGGTVTATLMFA